MLPKNDFLKISRKYQHIWNSLHQVNTIDRIVNMLRKKKSNSSQFAKICNTSFWHEFQLSLICKLMFVFRHRCEYTAAAAAAKSTRYNKRSINPEAFPWKHFLANIAIHSPSRMKPKSYLCNCKCSLPLASMLMESMFDFHVLPPSLNMVHFTYRSSWNTIVIYFMIVWNAKEKHESKNTFVCWAGGGVGNYV